MQIQTKVKCQEVENFHLQQKIEELQQKEGDSKKSHKLEITKFNNTLTSSTEEIYRIRNHNKILITKIKKLKHSCKKEQSNEDLEGRVLENQEENRHLKNLNRELEKEVEKLKEDKKSQDERFEKIQSKNNVQENKIAQIQKEASRLSQKQSQVAEVNSVLAIVQKEETQTKHTTYIHPNYNPHFYQR